MTVPYGLGGKSDIVLHDCTVDDFKFSPMNGGSVVMQFRVICHPDTADVGRLCEFIQQSIELDVQPPAPQTPEDLFKPAKRKSKKAQESFATE